MPYLPQRNPDGWFSLFSQARAGAEDPVCHQLRWSLPNGKSHGNHMEIIWKFDFRKIRPAKSSQLTGVAQVRRKGWARVMPFFMPLHDMY